METLSERIALIIKESGLTRTKFAEKLGLSQPYVSQLALGSATPGQRTISDISREFGYTEEWIRTGIGPKKIPLSDDADFIQVMAEIQVSDDPFIRKALTAYWKLDQGKKQAIWALMSNFIEAQTGQE